MIPAATVNACPGNDDGGVGEFAETVERDLDHVGDVVNSDGDVDEFEIVMEATGEVHPLVFLVFSQGLKKTDRIAIHVDLPPLDTSQG
ncbi:MAG: hypothetical protein QGM46_06235 [Actinomycetota bacterium]|nr:hypothetical protein [Actinomycetota bacterium]MDK1039610.1 hypothetical protein [Actinomycetota bacterium]MDK1097735.1 hypothetical protein [Actinomycetota bacterium]MDK1291933.1 hypothetical protein [Actinomycetota bacterium]